MKKLISLIFILLLASTALADTYELHTPDRNQVKKDQALAYANDLYGNQSTRPFLH